MFTTTQVSEMLGLPLSVVRQYVGTLSTQLSPHCQRGYDLRFTEADVAVISRARAPSAQNHMVTIRCAWCGRDLGVKHGYGASGVSHGMCPGCASRFLADYDLASEPSRG